MKASTGVILSPENVLGRDGLIDRLWRWLKIKSVRLEAERRIGKTSIIRRMTKQPPDGWFPIYMDLEKYHTAEEFAQALAGEVEQFLSRFKRTGRRIGGILSVLRGIKLGAGGFDVTIPQAKEQADGYWKQLLQASVEDLVETKEERVVFFFDEMPSLLSAIAKGPGGAARAMEVLDTLRYLRQTEPTADGFRMVMTGSIGLHHVVETLRDGGYSNPALNDLEPIEVPPLDPTEAQNLARLLIEGEKLKTNDIAESARVIAEETGGFPFYLQSVVVRLAIDSLSANAADVKKVVRESLRADRDPWQLRYFRDRVGIYYTKDKAVALAILDTVAVTEKPLAVPEVVTLVKHKLPADAERVGELLQLLSQDHYVTCDDEGRYSFRFPLLCRWWKLNRGLQ
jgi:hypothetical protein